MGLRLPKNQFVTNYTSGGEYLVEITHQNYQGYYYEYNNKAYAGKFFSIKAPRLIKKGSNEVNKLLLNPSTAQYAISSGVKLPSTDKIISLPDNRYRELDFYCKKINDAVIKIIKEEDYLTLKSNPLYQTTYIGTYNGQYQSPEYADNELPGIKIFKESELDKGRE
jgi:hypothetical protein